MKSRFALLAKCIAAAAALVLLSAPAIGQTATVTTNKYHYTPGETVIITGTGWQPGETVLMVLHEEPFTHPDIALSSVADSSGNFTNTEYSPGEHDAGVTFTLTATGQSSGRTAQTTFIDAPAPQFDIVSNHVTSLGSHVFTALVRNVVGSSSDAARCIRVTAPASVTVTGATHTVASPGTTGPWTLGSGANFVELRTDTNSNTGLFGSTLASDNWVRFQITATTSSIATEEWLAWLSSDRAKSDCKDSEDKLGVSVAESLPRQYSADFRDGSDNVIAAPSVVEDSTQAFRIRITRTGGSDDLSRAVVALPTCLTNITTISTTSSGSPSFSPDLSDNVFLLTTFTGTKIAANADWVQVHFTATVDCSPGQHAFRTAAWKNQNPETSQGDIFQLSGTGLPPLTVTPLAVCGNSIVESAEECDQGAANGTSGSCCSATCTFESAATVCRPGSGDLCDPAEFCTGSSAACPVDSVAPATTVCNAGSGDLCDPTEFCSGIAGQACATDNVAGAGTVCNPGSGDICDPSEVCSGVADQACPADTFQPSSFVCNEGSGDVCDPDEFCTGVADAACPTDTIQPTTFACNEGSGDLCDPTEFCSGVAGQACATDNVAGAGTVCNPGSGDICDPSEVCSGVADQACPADTFQPSSFVCNEGSGDVCDPDEFCTGVADAACPTDTIQPTTFACNEGSGDLCDPTEFCSGVAGQACATDNVAGAGTVCNPGSGDICDPSEVCSGVADQACPADTFQPSSYVCNPGSGDVCDPSESCTGVADQACPADTVAPATTVCRSEAGVCDAAEQCTGVADAACPGDSKKGLEATCRGSAGLCDVAESCNGASNDCPADMLQPPTTVCRPEANACDAAESCTGLSPLCPDDVQQPRVFLVIDEESIDNGNPPNHFSATDVNDHIARIGLRSELPYFAANENDTITLHTGTVGDEGWFAPKTIPSKWNTVGPTADGLRNFLLAGPGLGSGSNPERYLDKIPNVTPLRATGLKMLEGACVCAMVYDSNVSINYGPLNGSLKGANLGLAAFEVEEVTQLTGYSSGSLPKVEVEIRDTAEVCNGPLSLFSQAPAPTSSSQPYDIAP